MRCYRETVDISFGVSSVPSRWRFRSLRFDLRSPRCMKIDTQPVGGQERVYLVWTGTANRSRCAGTPGRRALVEFLELSTGDGKNAASGPPKVRGFRVCTLKWLRYKVGLITSDARAVRVCRACCKVHVGEILRRAQSSATEESSTRTRDNRSCNDRLLDVLVPIGDGSYFAGELLVRPFRFFQSISRRYRSPRIR